MNDFKISSFTGLNQISKQICERCGRKRMYFCYDCHVYMPSTSMLVPTVELPFKIDIIKDQREKNSKSTAIHCLLLAPSATTVYDAPLVPQYSRFNGENVVLVYPSSQAQSVAEVIREHGTVDRFVFLDATWFQVSGLLSLPQLQGLPHVKLKSHKTLYWRPQKGYSDEYLATIEAIYYTACEVFQSVNPESYDGRFDNLLFWFFYFRRMVNTNIIENNSKNRIVAETANDM